MCSAKELVEMMSIQLENQYQIEVIKVERNGGNWQSTNMHRQMDKQGFVCKCKLKHYIRMQFS